MNNLGTKNNKIKCTYYNESVKLDNKIQKLYMLYLIRLVEDIELNDNFVDALWNVYVGVDNIDYIDDFVVKLTSYCWATGQHINQICIENFKDYLED